MRKRIRIKTMFKRRNPRSEHFSHVLNTLIKPCTKAGIPTRNVTAVHYTYSKKLIRLPCKHRRINIKR